MIIYHKQYNQQRVVSRDLQHSPYCNCLQVCILIESLILGKNYTCGMELQQTTTRWRFYS